MKFKLFGLQWDLTIPIMFIYMCLMGLLFTWPFTFNDSTHPGEIIIYSVIFLIVLAVVPSTIKHLEDRDDESTTD